MRTIACVLIALALAIGVATASNYYYGPPKYYRFGYHVRHHGGGYGNKGYAEVDRHQDPYKSTYTVQQTHPHGGYSQVYSSIGGPTHVRHQQQHRVYEHSTRGNHYGGYQRTSHRYSTSSKGRY